MALDGLPRQRCCRFAQLSCLMQIGREGHVKVLASFRAIPLWQIAALSQLAPPSDELHDRNLRVDPQPQR